MQLAKCVVWFSYWLDHSISFPPSFFTFDMGFCILGANGIHIIHLIIVIEVFHKNLRMISSFPMLADPQTTFVMFLLCYVWHPDYLLCIMFLSPSIL